jgi:hypothetical protein
MRTMVGQFDRVMGLPVGLALASRESPGPADVTKNWKKSSIFIIHLTAAFLYIICIVYTTGDDGATSYRVVVPAAGIA